jgi:DNA-directed RNA polymerase
MSRDAYSPPPWPRPPWCVTARQLATPPDGARVAIAGLVICRQRPGTAKGVIFLTLEDETGTANIVVWAKMFERFRRAVIAGRALKVTGRLQRDGDVVHVVAERIEDISALLDEIVHCGPAPDGHDAAPDPHAARETRCAAAEPTSSRRFSSSPAPTRLPPPPTRPSGSPAARLPAPNG